MTLDGMSRREDNETAITLGEVYRLCQRIDERMTQLGDGIERDVHSLRNRIQLLEVSKALHDKDIEGLQRDLAEVQDAQVDKAKEWRGYFSAGAIGGVLALLPQIPAFLKWLAQ